MALKCIFWQNKPYYCILIAKNKSIMLIQFSVKNFTAFKNKATLSLIASNYDKETLEQSNVAYLEKFDLRLLKSAVIYGANASGKSKLIEALFFMKNLVISSSNESQKGDKIKVEPFKLNTDTEGESSEFEVLFYLKNILYRYGFEVDKNEIVSEWLFQKNLRKEVEIFYRSFQKFDVHSRSFSKGKAIIKKGLIRENALLVSAAAQFNDETSISIIKWFKELKIISGLREDGFSGYTMNKTNDPLSKEKIVELVKVADLGIQDIKLKYLDINNLPENMPSGIKDKIIKESTEENKEFYTDVLTFHRKYDSLKNRVGIVNFELGEEESSGTRKFLYLTGPILDVLDNGYTLFVDELDSKLHPNLVCKIVSLFNDPEINKKNAQLVFNTHDTNLLSSKLFRRDQIWFAEKNKYGESSLYSLSDFKSEVRKTEAFEENYLRGKYGAIPILGNFDNINKILSTNENER